VLDGSRAVASGEGLEGPMLVGCPAVFDVDTRAVTAGSLAGGNLGNGQRGMNESAQLHVEVIGM